MINFITKNKLFLSLDCFIYFLFYGIVLFGNGSQEISLLILLLLFTYFLFFISSIYIVIYSFREILKIYAKYRLLNKLIENPYFEKIFRISADILYIY